MANGLLDLLGGLGTTPPAYLEGLLGQPATEDLRKRSIGTGLANALVGYLAMPKNQNLGLGRILAGAAQAGMQGAQGVYEGATADYLQAQKIAELQRAKKQQETREAAIAQLPAEQQALYRAYGEAAVPKLVEAAMPKQRERKTATVNNVVIDTDTGLPIYIGEKEEKVGASTTLNKLLTERANLIQQNPNDPNLKFYDEAIKKETSKSDGVTVNYGAPVSGVDAQGNPVFFQPSKTGGAPTIISGVKPPEQAGAKPSEFESKAGLYFKSMRTATNTLNNLELTNDKFMPSTGEILFDESTKKGQYAVSKIRPTERKQYIQAQKQWIDSINRVRSGANLPEIEYNRAVATFFPQYNDPDDVVQQKSLARAQEEEAMKVAAGKALPKDNNQIAPAAPQETLAKSKVFNIDGKKVPASLGSDGKYYVNQGGKKYRVEE